MVVNHLLFFCLLVLFLIPFASSAQKVNYTINGVVKGLEGEKVYLKSRTESISDSTLVYNNKFQFKGSIAELEIVTITIGKEELLTALYGGNLKINGQEGQLSNANVSGQQVAIDFKEWKSIADFYLNQRLEIHKKHQIAAKVKDTLEMIRYGKENDAVYPAQENAIKRWVMKHPNSLISPIIDQN